MEDLKPLSEMDIGSKLKSLSGWKFKDDKISKEFEFPTFIDGLMTVTQLGFFSEKIDHHPDIHIFYNKIRFELQRFDIGGKVTERDFTVAHEIERLATLHHAQ